MVSGGRVVAEHGGLAARVEHDDVDVAVVVQIVEGYSSKQFWWSKHEPFFQEKLDTRGKDDVASRLGEWTRVECICGDDRVTIKINGVTVNEALDVWPTSGKILLQNEGNEMCYRRFELHPLKK